MLHDPEQFYDVEKQKQKYTNPSQIQGGTSLMMECFRGHPDVVKFLVNNGAETNVKGSEEVRPPFISATYRREDLD